MFDSAKNSFHIFYGYRRQIFASFAANVGAFAFGSSWSFTASALPSMREEVGGVYSSLSSEQESFLTAILFLGCIVSSPLSGYGIENYGRKFTMMVTNIPCIAAWLIIAFSKDIRLVYLGRFLTGVCSASYGSSAPLYVAEISSPEVRGRLVCSFDTMIAAGMLFINIVGIFTPWQIQAIVCSIVPLVAQILLMYCPESPRFLIDKGSIEEAQQSLQWLQPSSSQEKIRDELLLVSESADIDRQDNDRCGWKIMFEIPVLKPILVGCVLMFFHQFCGNYPILAYGLSGLRTHDRNDASSSTYASDLYALTAINGAQFIASFIPVFYVDNLGRKPLLLFSELVMTISLLALGTVTFLKIGQGEENFEWISIVCLVLYELGYAVGIGPIPWLLMGELVSPKSPGLSVGIVTGFYRVLGFLQLYFFHDITILLGAESGGPFFFFGAICLVGSLVCYLIIRDTTGETLEDIHNRDVIIVNNYSIKNLKV